MPRKKKQSAPEIPASNGDGPGAAWAPGLVSSDLRKKVLEMGVDPRFIVDRTTHPSYHATLWTNWGTGYETLGDKMAHRLPHIAYNSVLVVVMSNMWSEGCWAAFQDMIKYSEEQGYDVSYQEIGNFNFLHPRDAIGTMRATAALMAQDAGMEWCLMLDTDVILKKDTLVRLLQHDRPVVYPYVVDLEQRYPGSTMMRPVRKPGSGLQPVVWSVMSCMLFDTKVFNALPAHAWYGDDFMFSQYLRHVGHRIHVDTDTIIDAVKGPARHNSWSWDELHAGLKRSFEMMRYEDRDRRPPPDFDPAFSEGEVTPDGAYWSSNTPWPKAPGLANNDFGQHEEIRVKGGVTG